MTRLARENGCLEEMNAFELKDCSRTDQAPPDEANTYLRTHIHTSEQTLPCHHLFLMQRAR